MQRQRHLKRNGTLSLALLLFLLSIKLATADTERITLTNGESFLFDGKNITLIDSSEDSVIICVNKVKIISDEKTVNGVIIDLINSDEGQAELRLDFECRDDCGCDLNECNNDICFRSQPSGTTSIETSIETTIGVTSSTETTADTTIDGASAIVEQQEETNNNIKTVTYVLIGVAVVMGIAAYTRKGKKDDMDKLIADQG